MDELNNLEDEFIDKINFTVWVDEELFEKYRNYLYLYKKNEK
jgi:hypothetical protein